MQASSGTMATAWWQRLLDWLRSLFWTKEMELSLIGLQNAGKQYGWWHAIRDALRQGLTVGSWFTLLLLLLRLCRRQDVSGQRAHNRHLPRGHDSHGCAGAARAGPRASE